MMGGIACEVGGADNLAALIHPNRLPIGPAESPEVLHDSVLPQKGMEHLVIDDAGVSDHHALVIEEKRIDLSSADRIRDVGEDTVLPEKRIASQVRGEREAEHLAAIVHDDPKRIRTAQSSQVPHCPSLPQEGTHLRTKAEQIVGYGVGRKSGHLPT